MGPMQASSGIRTGIGVDSGSMEVVRAVYSAIPWDFSSVVIFSTRITAGVR